MSKVTLTLMRHAKSSWQNHGQSDHDRPLNERGHRDAPIMAARLKERGDIPSLILSSSAQRTQQTTAHLLDVFGEPSPEVHYDERLYLGSPESILDILNDVPDAVNHVIVVAHNPGIEDLSALLSGTHSDTMPTAAIRQFLCPSFKNLTQYRKGNKTHNTAGKSMAVQLSYSDYPKNKS